MEVPDMLAQVVKKLDRPSHASVRLTTKAIHAASYSSVTALVVRASCSNGLLWPAPSSLTLFPYLERLSLRLVDVPQHCRSNTPAAIVGQVLGVFPQGMQPQTFTLSCSIFSSQLSHALAAHRGPGHTVIVADHLSGIPVLRIPPLSAPSPRAITITAIAHTIGDTPGWANQLTALTISHHAVPVTPLGDLEDSLFGYFDRSYLPCLARLDIGLGGASIDLAEEMEVDLTQLQDLTLWNLELGDRRLNGLAAASPGLIKLKIHSYKLLAIPTAPDMWDSLESLTLTVGGTMSHFNALLYSQTAAYFPGTS